jgi:hypothetical protein
MCDEKQEKNGRQKGRSVPVGYPRPVIGSTIRGGLGSVVVLA